MLLRAVDWSAGADGRVAPAEWLPASWKMSCPLLGFTGIYWDLLGFTGMTHTEGHAEARTTDPIPRVSMISTGSVSIHPEHVGPNSKPLPLWLFTSRRWTEPNPINVSGIEHREGQVLLDTGQARASVAEPDCQFPRGRRAHRGDLPPAPGPHRRTARTLQGKHRDQRCRAADAERANARGTRVAQIADRPAGPSLAADRPADSRRPDARAVHQRS